MRSEPRSARTPVWPLSISLAATLEIDKFSFSSSGYLDVSVPRVPHVQLCIHCTLTEVSSAGFPHSDISGSMDMCSSPKLFAAYHVFHRLLVPRHPPCALTTLTVAGTIESLDSLFPHWCIALHQRALCFFHFPISLLTMKFEFLWCLDSFPFLKMNSIINSCMKFSRYIRVSETISCIFDTSGLIDHAIQECLFLDRIIDKSKTLL